jgi:hypothetical protein
MPNLEFVVCKDPCIAVSVMDHNSPYDMVTVGSKVVEQTGVGAAKHIDRVAKNTH